MEGRGRWEGAVRHPSRPVAIVPKLLQQTVAKAYLASRIRSPGFLGHPLAQPPTNFFSSPWVALLGPGFTQTAPRPPEQARDMLLQVTEQRSSPDHCPNTSCGTTLQTMCHHEMSYHCLGRNLFNNMYTNCSC